MNYQLMSNPFSEKSNIVLKTEESGRLLSIPFDPANTDYQTFRKEVLAGAELQDADGNVMTDAKDYVRTLP